MRYKQRKLQGADGLPHRVDGAITKGVTGYYKAAMGHYNGSEAFPSTDLPFCVAAPRHHLRRLFVAQIVPPFPQLNAVFPGPFLVLPWLQWYMGQTIGGDQLFLFQATAPLRPLGQHTNRSPGLPASGGPAEQDGADWEALGECDPGPNAQRRRP